MLRLVPYRILTASAKETTKRISTASLREPFQRHLFLSRSCKMSESQNATSNNTSTSTLTAEKLPDAKKGDADALGFVAKSRSVHIYRPKKEKKVKSDSKETSSVLSPIKTDGVSPSVVLIMGWMNAPLRIVLKYATPYAKLFPQATIIIKLSTGSAFMASAEAREASFKGIVSLLEEAQSSSEAKAALHGQVAELELSANQAGIRLDVDTQNRLQQEAEKQEQPDASSLQPPPQQSGMLIHSFSDGGANNLSLLLRQVPGKNVPKILANIFDCSPGIASARSGSIAFSIPFAKRPFVHLLVRSTLYFYLTLLGIIRILLRRRSWSQIMRAHLNEAQTWGYSQSNKQASKVALPPRMYLYSKADKLINWRAVEEHAREAAALQGLSGSIQVDQIKEKKDEKTKSVVVTKRWDHANHCDLGRADFEGYWTTVRTFLQNVL
jgi:hypothetical protein